MASFTDFLNSQIASGQPSLLDRFTTGLLGAPQTYGGILSPAAVKDSQRRALMALSQNLLAASGPSRTPVSLGQALGGGLAAAGQAQEQASQTALQSLLLQAQLRQKQRTPLTEVSPGASLYDPEAQKAVYTAPTADKPQTPLDELAKLNADYQAGRISKEDYDARRNLMITRPTPASIQLLNDPRLQKGMTDQAHMIATYRSPLPPGFSARNPATAELYSKVLAENPSFDATTYPTRQKAVAAFSTGKQGDQVRAFNVGLSHLETASDLVDALGNGNIVGFNRLAQALAEQTGSPAPTNFETAKQIVRAEIVKAVVGGQAAEADREHALGGIDKASSPAQLKGAIDTAKKLMGGQLGGLKRQYERSTQLKDFESLLSPDAIPYLSTKEASGNETTAGAGVRKVIDGKQYVQVNGQWYEDDGT